ncbi:MAG TPA: TonB-dependent receptor [Steroidobacteraceae bacterium]|nr:TonB-dependent receptor [Steroidobacteraceae bacterium]
MNAADRLARCAPPCCAVLLLCQAQIATAVDMPADRLPASEQVIVYGQRLTPTAPGEAVARLEAARVPGGTNVVGSDEYADGRAANLVDVFALAPGVFVQPRFGAEEARLSIRGSGLQRTFHMRGIYLLQDGVPITLADGSGDFQAVEPLSLAYTEVMRGANALQYGGTTLGGSVNFISPSGFDGAGFRPRLETGSFGYLRGVARLGGQAGASDYFLSLSAYAQDGYRDWSEQKNQRAFGNIGFKLSERLETRLYFSAVNSDSQLPGSLTKAQLQADPEQANAGNLSGRQRRDFELYRLGNRTVLDLDDATVELTLGYSYKDLWHPIFQVLQQRSNDYNAGVRYLDRHSLGGFDNRFVIGFAPSWNAVDDDRWANVGGRPGARTAASKQTSRNRVVFAEDELALNPRWSVVAGVQWTDAERRYRDRFLGNGDQGVSASYDDLLPKLGFVFKPGEHWNVFGNVSDSFEAPSFGELSGGPNVETLKAQTARTVELGSRGVSGFASWDIALYASEVRDELLSLNAPGGQPLGTVNAPRTVHRGIELGLALQLAPEVSWRSSYLWNDFRFDDNATYGDNRLPGIPEHFYRGELSWSFLPTYAATLTGEWSPRRYAIDMANSWHADSYALVGVKLARTVSKGLSWFVEGRNLTDRNYAATTGVIADARGQDAAQFLPGDGRAVYAGIEWRVE